MKKKAEFPRLLWISPGDGLSEALLRRLQVCVAAGLRAFQLREKASFARQLAVFAPRLRRILPPDKGVVLINDRLDVCLAADFDGVQLGHGSLAVRQARHMLGPQPWIGRSVHDERELVEAEEGGADFVLVSPVYAVRKRGMPNSAPLGLVGLRRLCQRSSLPVLALGGIQAERVDELLEQGVHGIAVLSAIAKSDDPRQVVETLLERLA